jgi:iron complex transport system ATP-binding protein
MIALANYSAALAGKPVLHGVTLSAGPGEFVAICGPNGAGKTTLLRALAGLLPGGRPDPRHTAYVEQGARAAWGITVRQLAALGRIPHADADEAAITSALQAAGIAPLADSRVDAISGGQARRAMLARALATQPKTLLLDEPVADLDPAAAHEIMALLAAFAASGGTVIAVLHALELATAYATRLVLLQAGRILADAAPHEVLPQAAAAFGMVLQPDARPLLTPAPAQPT